MPLHINLFCKVGRRTWRWSGVKTGYLTLLDIAEIRFFFFNKTTKWEDSNLRLPSRNSVLRVGGLGGLGAQGGRNWLITSGRRQPPAFCPNILAFLFCFFGQSSFFCGFASLLVNSKKSNCLKTFFPIFSFVGSKVVKMPFLVLSVVVCDSNRHILRTYSIFSISQFYTFTIADVIVQFCPILSSLSLFQMAPPPPPLLVSDSPSCQRLLIVPSLITIPPSDYLQSCMQPGQRQQS